MERNSPLLRLLLLLAELELLPEEVLLTLLELLPEELLREPDEDPEEDTDEEAELEEERERECFAAAAVELFNGGAPPLRLSLSLDLRLEVLSVTGIYL